MLRGRGELLRHSSCCQTSTSKASLKVNFFWPWLFGHRWRPLGFLYRSVQDSASWMTPSSARVGLDGSQSGTGVHGSARGPCWMDGVG